MRTKKICNCRLKPQHYEIEHDWCCQICGGNHSERICPKKKPNKLKSRIMEIMPSENWISTTLLARKLHSHLYDVQRNLLLLLEEGQVKRQEFKMTGITAARTYWRKA